MINIHRELASYRTTESHWETGLVFAIFHKMNTSRTNGLPVFQLILSQIEHPFFFSASPRENF